jgi:Pyruvate/2-oxoacid:ferredoxin oxidoreductase delta subunit
MGARKVTILYNRSRKELPAEPVEVAEAEREGVEFRYLATPTRITVKGGKATGVSFKTALLGPPTSLGRRRIVGTKGPVRRLVADLVVTTPNYIPDLSPFDETIPTTLRKTVHVDPVTLATPVDGLFAAGDAVTGPRNFIRNLASGRKAALSIHRYLRGEDMRPSRESEGSKREIVSISLDRVEKLARIEEPALSDSERTSSFDEVHLLPDEEAIIAEAQRCLHCGACTHCDTCVIQCPEDAISKVDGDYVIDYDKCTGCRVCVEECPTSAIQMPAVGACVACGYCLKRFECPSLVRGEDGRIEINRLTCVDCGLCMEVCGQKAIVPLG